MPRRKSKPRKVTKVMVVGRRGRRKMSYRRGNRGVAGTKWNYSKQKMISIANISAVQGSTEVNAYMPFMQRAAVAGV